MNMKPTKFGVGQSVKRVEDIRFVSGRGNYASDAVDKADLKAVFLRSPYGHAKFRIDDIEAARAELSARGGDVSEIFHRGPQGRVPGPDPDRPSYGSLATFNDPDGNVWLLQQVTQRLPGRVSVDQVTFTSPADLAAALRRAAAAHGEHEKRTGGHDDNWPDWYAEYIVKEQAGERLPV